MEPIAVLVAASAAGLAVWLGGVGYTWWQTRPHVPVPAPPTIALPSEPPAIVNLLTDGWKVSSEAVPATLLDLGARGVVGIERVPGAREEVRVRDDARAVTAYEDQVLAHVSIQAAGGIVAAEALTTGPRDASKAWWRAFRRGVIADAHTRGLTVDRFPWAVLAPLWVALFVPALIYLAAVRFDLDNAGRSGGARAMLFALLGAFALVAWLTGSHLQRDTPEGLRAAGRWLGVRAHLAQNEVLQTVPPSAVATYGRHLAYAAAMGLARAAVEGLPLGAEDDHEAWSPEGGRWHHVRVRYPRFRPGWGSQPRQAILLGALCLIPSAWLIVWTTPWDYPEAGRGLTAWMALWVGRIWAVVGIGLAIAALSAAYAIIAGALDLNARADVEGTIVRLRDREVVQLNPWRRGRKRRYYVAVDDGTTPRIDAWSIRPETYAQLAQRARARATVTHVLAHVEQLDPIP